MSTIKKFGKVLGWIMFGCLAMLILVLLSPIFPTKKFLRSYIVTSGSMAPTVKAGSLVFVHPVPIGTLRIGDIIAFTLPGDAKTTVLHRVNFITPNPLTYHTKGDNNNATDNWSVPASSIIGAYILAIPGIGYATNLIRTKLGFAIFIGIPVLFLIYSQIRLIIDGIEEEIQKRLKKQLVSSPATSEKILLFFLASLTAGSLTAISLSRIEARFTTQATIKGVSISANAASPSPSPSPQPTTTPAPSPSPTPTCPPGQIILSDNGEGSHNSVDIDCQSSTTIHQSNSTDVQTNIETNADTGGNVVDGNTSSTSINTSSSSTTVDVQVDGGNNGQ